MWFHESENGQTLPAKSSIILPTVIREGKPCGFMIVSAIFKLAIHTSELLPTHQELFLDH